MSEASRTISPRLCGRPASWSVLKRCLQGDEPLTENGLWGFRFILLPAENMRGGYTPVVIERVRNGLISKEL